MITSLDGYSVIVEARRAEQCKKPEYKRSPQQEREREIDRSHLNVVLRMMLNLTRSQAVVSKRSIRKRMLGDKRLGETHEEREAMFERAWNKAAATSARMYIDDIDDPDRYSNLRPGRNPRTARRSPRVRVQRRVA